MRGLENKEALLCGHRERLRMRMETEGWDALKPYEMIELILYYAVTRQDVGDIARALIDRFGTVGGVFRATRGELLSVPGVNAAMVDWLTMTGRLVYAYGDLCGEGVSIIRYGDVVRFLAPRMSSLHAPSCWALYTDFENNLLYCSTLCESLEWWTPECVRRLVRESASLGARNLFIVVFTGNIAQVLGEDIQDCLLKVACTMKAVDVKLLDCILASDNGFYSMNASGRMDAARNVVMRPSPGESYAAEHPFEPQGDGW